MNNDSKDLRNGGQILVEALCRNSVNTIYCVPGESYLPVLDALAGHQEIKTINTRHEGAASNMADAYGKITGRPGIAFVTRGPGATHAANGVHTAMQDSTPMILFIGQVGTGIKEREGFQEIDYRQMFGRVAKWATEIESIDRIPEIIHRAFNVAMSGRKGPVVIALPEDVLFGTANVLDLPKALVGESHPAPTAISEIEALLKNAQRPLVIVGGTGWTPEAQHHLKSFVQRFNLPVAAGFRRQDVLDNRNPHYVGQLGLGISAALADQVKQSDLLIVLGSRLSEVTSGNYEIIKSPLPDQKLVHAHADAGEINRVFHADVPVCATVEATISALDKLPDLVSPPAWGKWTETARANYIAHNSPVPRSPEQTGVELSHVVAHLSKSLPEDSFICNGAGNYTVWVHRFFQYKQLGTELASTNGAMGYGLPAAIAAKIERPESTVVCFAGDGCFMMYPQELATAIQFGAAIIVIVVNNGMLGTIRMHQEREYPGRVSATDLVNPDFVALAQSFGAYAERVEKDEDFAEAFQRAKRSGRAALLELCTDPAQITPQARLKTH
ncbi:thiamine pyrophosphate-binding protein [Polynucleobacter sp. Fuers-14]|uniref:thiamine pyrophosphate-binding protein n=1 Tax=Polynucleobacter sp. Fuers-14 TaxID=1758364 RepID=UPI001C0CE77A|nr:thiamine pyrophosphate-binding protein [Polynucleobacter sp. Fuers-14]MBU3641971.1 thiamine pyrophosphate-binding protein [Polynucleobacter sp. Fuers-14]